MKSISEKNSIVKIQWNKIDDKWGAVLLLANRNGFKKIPLKPELPIDVEVTDERRCIGYIDENGRHLCPEFSPIDSGSKCYPCRQKDIHIDYIEGRTGEQRDGQHSVYVVQIGDIVKVGITRTGRLMRRWIEQGAIYAAEIERCQNADDALSRESEISDLGYPERINKSKKGGNIRNDDTQIQEALDDLAFDSEIVDVQENTIYPNEYTSPKPVREGKISGNIRTVRGQLISTGDQCLAVTSGRCIQQPDQMSITDF